MSKQNANGAAEAEKLIEVRLLKNYVPANPERVEGTPESEPVFVKRWAGEVLSLPRTEAKRVIDLGIAQITADLI